MTFSSSKTNSLCIKLTENFVFDTALRIEAQQMLEKLRHEPHPDQIIEIPLIHTQDAKQGILLPRKRTETTEVFAKPTEYLSDVFKSWLFDMRKLGWHFYFMRLLFIPPGFEAPLHTDEIELLGENRAYRFHHTLVGDEHSPMEWQVGEGFVSVHLEQGPEPYFIRVDVPHKMTNRSKQWRIHLLSSVLSVPSSLKGHFHSSESLTSP